MIAERELIEETGLKVKSCKVLGDMPPDSGLTGVIIPVLPSEIISEGDPRFDKNEAIAKKYFFTYKELHASLRKGILEVKFNGETIRAHCRDPFLSYAMLLDSDPA